MSGDDFECRFCKTNAEIVYVHDFMGELVWEGCVNCLIAKLERQDKERKALKKSLEQALSRKDVDCICEHIQFGCKCGAIARERFLKKCAALA